MLGIFLKSSLERVTQVVSSIYARAATCANNLSVAVEVKSGVHSMVTV